MWCVPCPDYSQIIEFKLKVDQSFCSVSESNIYSLQNKAPVNVFQFLPAIFLFFFFFSCGWFSNTKRWQLPNNADKYPSVSCSFFFPRVGIHRFHASHSAKRSSRWLQTTTNFNWEHVTTFMQSRTEKRMVLLGPLCLRIRLSTRPAINEALKKRMQEELKIIHFLNFTTY